MWIAYTETDTGITRAFQVGDMLAFGRNGKGVFRAASTDGETWVDSYHASADEARKEMDEVLDAIQSGRAVARLPHKEGVQRKTTVVIRARRKRKEA